MTPEHVGKLRELFLAVRGLPAEQRIPILQDACGNDAAMRLELEGLLAADASDGGLVMPADEAAANRTEASPRPPSQLHLPVQIGRYRILELIGEGGMGAVYKAEQRTPVHRIVAVKVIRTGPVTREVLARFQSEREALARMDHPNIARVLDADSDDDGRPYFVMEYAPGAPLTRFADANCLSISHRLKLFLQVCEAIQHSHDKGIIHRDIKASNVLGFISEGKPRVKVIDFGIAKAVAGGRLIDQTFNTAQGMIIGTYESMSPEQADSLPDIDTRTDVYSLGVLLYQLLAGVHPIDLQQLSKEPAHEIRRIIRDEDPPAPSTRLMKLGDTASDIARQRGIKLGDLTSTLRRELEWIPLKAMRRERDRRYHSPSELAGDIRNFLEGRPLIAGPESFWYRLEKQIQLNKTWLAIAIVGAGLVAIPATVAWATLSSGSYIAEMVAASSVFLLGVGCLELVGQRQVRRTGGASWPVAPRAVIYLTSLATILIFQLAHHHFHWARAANLFWLLVFSAPALAIHALLLRRISNISWRRGLLIYVYTFLSAALLIAAISLASAAPLWHLLTGASRSTGK